MKEVSHTRTPPGVMLVEGGKRAPCVSTSLTRESVGWEEETESGEAEGRFETQSHWLGLCKTQRLVPKNWA